MGRSSAFSLHVGVDVSRPWLRQPNERAPLRVACAGTATAMVHSCPQLLQTQESVSGVLPVQRTPSPVSQPGHSSSVVVVLVVIVVSSPGVGLALSAVPLPRLFGRLRCPEAVKGLRVATCVCGAGVAGRGPRARAPLTGEDRA
jgi:hypothetical protein